MACLSKAASFKTLKTDILLKSGHQFPKIPYYFKWNLIKSVFFAFEVQFLSE